MATHEDYRQAASLLWGEAGAFMLDTYQAHNREHFAGELPPLPMVLGLTAYGRCLGLTRGEWADDLPRITIASNLFAQGTVAVSDTILHEMIHAKLVLQGAYPKHDGEPWRQEIIRLSPAVLGAPILAAAVKPRRVEGKMRRVVEPGHLTQREIAHWPGHRSGGEVLAVDSY